MAEYDSNDYYIGELRANVQALTIAIRSLQAEITLLKTSVDDLKLWKSKIMGMAAVTAVLVSCGLNILITWAK